MKTARSFSVNSIVSLSRRFMKTVRSFSEFNCVAVKEFRENADNCIVQTYVLPENVIVAVMEARVLCHMIQDLRCWR